MLSFEKFEVLKRLISFRSRWRLPIVLVPEGGRLPTVAAGHAASVRNGTNRVHNWFNAGYSSGPYLFRKRFGIEIPVQHDLSNLREQ